MASSMSTCARIWSNPNDPGFAWPGDLQLQQQPSGALLCFLAAANLSVCVIRSKKELTKATSWISLDLQVRKKLASPLKVEPKVQTFPFPAFTHQTRSFPRLVQEAALGYLLQPSDCFTGTALSETPRWDLLPPGGSSL